MIHSWFETLQTFCPRWVQPLCSSLRSIVPVLFSSTASAGCSCVFACAPSCFVFRTPHWPYVFLSQAWQLAFLDQTLAVQLHPRSRSPFRPFIGLNQKLSKPPSLLLTQRSRRHPRKVDQFPGFSMRPWQLCNTTKSSHYRESAEFYVCRVPRGR